MTEARIKSGFRSSEMDDTTTNRRTAYRMLIIEALVVLFLSLFIYAIASLEFAYSVILGGVAFILPNALFISLSLGKSAANSEKSALAWFYIGEAIKIVSTILIFTVSIRYTPLNIWLMFVAYGLVLLINLTGLALAMNK